MKGNVIGFDPDTNTGAISGHDGNRYDFVTLDWRGPGRPRRGDLVDFQAIEQHATEIYLLEPQYIEPSLGQFYFSARGRISRSQYWLRFTLPYIAITLGLQLIASIAGENSVASVVIGVILLVLSLVGIWPSIAILIKRIHDRDKSGWLCLILYAPTVVFLIVLSIWVRQAAVAIVAATATGTVASAPAIGALAVVVCILGAISVGIGLWFFIEFGCMRGTIGANRHGADPVRASR